MAEPTTLRTLVERLNTNEKNTGLTPYRRGNAHLQVAGDALALLRDCRTALDWQQISTHGPWCKCPRCAHVTTLRDRLREDTDAD